jgi:hypothetical protein
MRRVNYDELERQVAQGWLDLQNPDNDPLVAAQIRGAEAAGKLAAFTTSEVDRARDADNMSVPFLALAALVANQLNNMLSAVSEPDRAVHGFLMAVAEYTDGMRELAETGQSEGVSEVAPITLPREEVPT